MGLWHMGGIGYMGTDVETTLMSCDMVIVTIGRNKITTYPRYYFGSPQMVGHRVVDSEE